MSAQEKSIGALFRGLTEDLSTLVRSEIALAKLEVKDAVVGVGTAGALFGAALFVALLAVTFLFVTLVLVLALFMPAWVAALIITVLLLVCAGVLAVLGKKRMARVKFMPEATIETMKTNVETIKNDLTRAARG